MALPVAPDSDERDGAEDPDTPTGREATGARPLDESDGPGSAGRGTGAPRASAAVRWGVLGLLIVVILGSLGYLGARVVGDGTGSGWGRVTSAFSGSDSLQSERDDAMSQARQFALRVNAYGPDLLDAKTGQMPKYRQLVEAVVTAKFRTDFENNGVPFAEASVSQTGVKRTTEVYSTGVATIDSDTATVLVAGSFTNSYPKKKGSTTYVTGTPEPYRFEVSMVKTGGKWLVDAFTPAEASDTGSSGSSGSSGSTGGTTGGTP
ncbi:hypothetical protein P5P86_18870 [Nocardioides sp. BP30]|uniref:hypothetical protein n=1 Tax=Nocardioides sp. BP30 TaxID=3036374 RepID=UPI002468C821|nr:hypothetical protein [Nocardioides sp. BP30]WGL52002.1 hypothetical protein P5P86_18870 [Nocardioides sp. BP30]